MTIQSCQRLRVSSLSFLFRSLERLFLRDIPSRFFALIAFCIVSLHVLFSRKNAIFDNILFSFPFSYIDVCFVRLGFFSFSSSPEYMDHSAVSLFPWTQRVVVLTGRAHKSRNFLLVLTATHNFFQFLKNS